MAKFQNGQQKPQGSGRKPGTPNRNSFLVKNALENLGISLPSKIMELLPSLPKAKQMDVLLELMQYVYPKRKPIEFVERDWHVPHYSELTPEDKEAALKLAEFFNSKEIDPNLSLGDFDWDAPPNL